MVTWVKQFHVLPPNILSLNFSHTGSLFCPQKTIPVAFLLSPSSKPHGYVASSADGDGTPCAPLPSPRGTSYSDQTHNHKQVTVERTTK